MMEYFEVKKYFFRFRVKETVISNSNDPLLAV